jgi:D-sedoheptulose 7-phosphate isomerase
MNALETLVHRYPELFVGQDSIQAAFELLRETYRGGGKVLICGNGGSAADSDHIVGELMKSFEAKRPVSTEMRQ